MALTRDNPAAMDWSVWTYQMKTTKKTDLLMKSEEPMRKDPVMTLKTGLMMRQCVSRTMKDPHERGVRPTVQKMKSVSAAIG